MGKIIKLKESQLTQLIKESIQKLNEGSGIYDAAEMEGKTIKEVQLFSTTADIIFTDGSLYTIYGDNDIRISRIRKPSIY